MVDVEARAMITLKQSSATGTHEEPLAYYNYNLLATHEGDSEKAHALQTFCQGVNGLTNYTLEDVTLRYEKDLSDIITAKDAS